LRILVTNDDGVYSMGLKLLYDSVRDLGKVIVFAPETPKSASGLGITLHKPLRVQRIRYWGIDIYVTNGTPSDIVYLALAELAPTIDLVVSGVNIGDNTSVQVVLSSGTVGAAAQAALLGIPAIAFSAAVESNQDFERRDYYEALKRVISRTVEHVARHRLPEGVDVLNVNFPGEVTPETRVKPARMARIKFLQRVSVSYDPRGNKYYWLYGTMADPEPGTDVYVVHVERNIAVTPISFKCLESTQVYEENRDYFEGLMGAMEEALRA